jgi:hypothetical protein
MPKDIYICVNDEKFVSKPTWHVAAPLIGTFIFDGVFYNLKYRPVQPFNNVIDFPSELIKSHRTLSEDINRGSVTERGQHVTAQ